VLSETYGNDRRLDTGRLYRYGLAQNVLHTRSRRAG
jgi:hypothetical protein